MDIGTLNAPDMYVRDCDICQAELDWRAVDTLNWREVFTVDAFEPDARHSSSSRTFYMPNITFKFSRGTAEDYYNPFRSYDEVFRTTDFNQHRLDVVERTSKRMVEGLDKMLEPFTEGSANCA